MIQMELQQKDTENTLLIYMKILILFHWINLLASYHPILLLIYLTLFYAYMCIFSIAFKP